MTIPWQNPFTWMALGAFGWLLGALLVATRGFGSSRLFGVACFTSIGAAAWVLPWEFVEQPRFEPGAARWIGLAGLLAGLALVSATFRTASLTHPRPSEPLRTGGAYALVRHPMALGVLLATFGWSLLRGSVLGLVMSAGYALCCSLVVVLEERRLVDAYGDDYRAYQRNVPRLLPLLGARRDQAKGGP